ncbi:MAG: hypothetical protein IFK94_04240 [Acidobacteria bacterium]|uniref:SD-repeat containing protein B domain-containing protein n=1 Tax=Candidatus Polarisedimenticola svalbardensis TaxID=2886004 RepID=A0A8J6Y7D2_9BACT|nr:hypothetical protein [Candidatus Polarisedimenticola svalbardensis]
MIRRRSSLLALVFVAAAVPSLMAQSVEGTLFEDLNGNGIHDAGEPALPGIPVALYGSPAAGGTVDQTSLTGAAGDYTFTPGNGCYLLNINPGPDYRFSGTRQDLYPEGSTPFGFPVGMPRFGTMENGIANLKGGALRFAALGDSIAYNWSSCNFFGPYFVYSRAVRDRLQCVAPAAAVSLDENAVKGEHTDDLLVNDGASDHNNLFAMIADQPEKITISIIGNDLLNVDPAGAPTQAELNRAVDEVLDSRQNLQETLSALLTEVPGTDIALNTLYDNLTWDCYAGTATSAFHRTWVPIMDQILRDLAWGQIRPVAVSEIAAEFAVEDLDGNPPGSCTGFDGMICRGGIPTDNIHPTNNGYQILREKVWESAGGVSLGGGDAVGRTAMTGVDYGLLRRVRRILPISFADLNGGQSVNQEAAFDDADGGLTASITLGAGQEEFRLDGFPDYYDEIEIVRVIAGVRYRTTGTVNDDFYRMEASLSGAFRPPPGHDYTPFDWNYYTPIVGGGGPNAPASNSDYAGAELLVVPDVTSLREASAMVTVNPVQDAGAVHYRWPAVTHEDLSTTAVRVVAAPVAGTLGNDNYQVELDGAWLDLYGSEKPRPGEIEGIAVSRGAGDLILTFDTLASADRYNLYFGRLAALPGYDHGSSGPATPLCDAGVSDLGGGRTQMVVGSADQPAESAYFLLTGHVDDVESPAGLDGAGVEIDRSQSVCR